MNPRTLTPGPLAEMSRSTETVLWNDSADPAELTTSLGFGAVGATCNPVIALSVLRAAPQRWQARVAELAADRPTATASELGWRAIEELSVAAAAHLEPVFAEHHGRNGRLSIQTDPRLFRDPAAIVEHAERLAGLAPNIIVKIPATAAGILAIEEATARGISINATVSFTVAQTLAVADAVERGLARRQASGGDISAMGPVCTIMVGRLDDWVKVAAEKSSAVLDPGYADWAGVAAFKRAYGIYRERGYRTRLLSAAFRNHLHWSQLVGGDVVISPPFAWQRRLNASGIEPRPRMDEPVDRRILDALCTAVPEFVRAYEPDGLTTAEFDGYGATRRTLRQFLAAMADLDAFVHDVIVPDPDR